MGRALVATPLALEDDPLARAIAPPEDETPGQRAERLQAEAQAKAVSDAIDAQLAVERLLMKKKERCVKVLLLGQSESGKSTTLKNFQLTYARKAWTAEKEAWRTVIQLNLVRSINTIADAVARELDLINSPNRPFTAISLAEDNTTAKSGALPSLPEAQVEADGTIEGDPDAEENDRGSLHPPPLTSFYTLTSAHRDLLAQLEPLRAVQATLERRLGAGAEEIEESNAGGEYRANGERRGTLPDSPNGSYSGNGAQDENAGNTSPPPARPAPQRTRPTQEFFVRSSGWKNALHRFRPRLSMSSRTGSDSGDDDDTKVISEKKDLIRKLWEDDVVREVIKDKKVKLIDSAEFFLTEVNRVADINYIPSDDDVIRARLRTVGVQEHHVTLETGPEAGREWLIYDVGGSRSMRAQWPSYFEGINAIIFLAPINCFDERLAEDRRINRLDDSLQLWKFVCASRLLQKTDLVLFLNKCDLLDEKLRKGVKFATYVKNYAGRENEAIAVASYLKTKFADVCRQYSKVTRGLHVYFTSVVDTKATARTLSAVQDGILRSHLRNLDLI